MTLKFRINKHAGSIYDYVFVFDFILITYLLVKSYYFLDRLFEYYKNTTLLCIYSLFYC